MMQKDKIAEYVEKVYAYAVKRTYSREEADELSQEILFTVVKELPKLKDESRFEPWLWGVAENVTRSFRRKQGRQRAMYSYDFPEDWFEQPADDESEVQENEELYGLLRGKISRLSAMYRDIIILHYYDGLSTKQISERLGIPEGTVTWRLSEARKKLKKECKDMEESALRPIKMRIDIYGNGNFDGKERPFPDVYISDALSQNILYYCYEQPKGVEELAKLCGVPAYYVEERLANLVKREAVIEPVKGKYQTNFIIRSDKYGIYCEENAEAALLPVYEKIMEALRGIAKEAGEIDFYKAEKSEADLFYLYGVMAFEYMRAYYYDNPFPEIKEKYDGFRWNYVASMESGAHPEISVGVNRCGNMDGRYMHTVFSWFGGFAYRDMMWDKYIDACEKILQDGGNGRGNTLCPAKELETEDETRDAVALAISDGYILRKEDGSLFVTMPAFTKAQKKQFDEIAEKYLAPIREEYTECVNKFLAGYMKLFPKRLEADAGYMCSHMFFSMYRVIIAMAQRNGEIEKPTPGSFCDVMVQYRE